MTGGGGGLTHISRGRGGLTQISSVDGWSDSDK